MYTRALCRVCDHEQREKYAQGPDVEWDQTSIKNWWTETVDSSEMRKSGWLRG